MSNERHLHRADRRIVYGRNPINPVLFRRTREVPEEITFSQQTGKTSKYSYVYEGLEGPDHNRAVAFTARVIPPQEVVNRDAVWGSRKSMERLVEGLGTMENPSKLFTHYPPEVVMMEQTAPLHDEDEVEDYAYENPEEFITRVGTGHPALYPKEIRNPDHVWPAPFIRAIQADVLKEWGEHAVHPDNEKDPMDRSVRKLMGGHDRNINFTIERIPTGDRSDEEFVDFDEEFGDVKIPIILPRHRKENYKLSSQFDDHLDEDNQMKLPGVD